MILRPVRPQSPSGPPTTKLPVGLTRKSEVFVGIQPFGSADSTASPIRSLTMPGVYFLPLRVCALCWVETTTLVQPTGLPSTYLHGDLALGVGLQVEQLPGAALVGEHLQDLVGEVDRGRHERALLVDLALGAGEAEHHALVAGAFLLAVLLLLGVDAHGDVGRLAVQQHLDVGAVIGEAVLVVADVLDHIARDLR